jgi:hypothetical protein
MANKRVQVKQAYVEEHGDPYTYFAACVLVCVAGCAAFIMALIAAGNYYG